MFRQGERMLKMTSRIRLKSERSTTPDLCGWQAMVKPGGTPMAREGRRRPG